MKSAVAYYRVSTQRQGRSGLRLDAQRAAVARFAEAEGIALLSEFTEVETGKGADALDRPDRPHPAAVPVVAHAHPHRGRPMTVAPVHQWLCPAGREAAAVAYTAAVGLDPAIEWQMQPGEQTALAALLAGSRPQVAVEIGGDTTGIAVDLSLPAGLAGQLAGIDRSITWCSRRWPATRTRCGPATPAPRLPW